MVPGLHQPGSLGGLVWEPKDVTWVDGEILLNCLPLLSSLTSMLERSSLSSGNVIGFFFFFFFTIRVRHPLLGDLRKLLTYEFVKQK